MTGMKCVVVFESVHQAIRAEKILQEIGIAYDMIPTPREISASCGQSIEVPMEVRAKVELKLSEAGVRVNAYYSRDAVQRIFERL